MHGSGPRPYKGTGMEHFVVCYQSELEISGCILINFCLYFQVDDSVYLLSLSYLYLRPFIYI